MLKNKSDKLKLNLQNPIKIEFENKELEDFVIQASSIITE